MIIEIAGKRVQVDDSFKDLSPEDQQAQVDLIANKMASGEGESASEYDSSKPAMGAAIGTTAGAMLGPTAGSAVDLITEKIAQQTIGPDKAKNQAIANWLKTQTTGPDVGGATYKDAFKKSETARGVPIQSRGSQIPIRKGFLGIENQPTPPSLPQKTAANILEGERLNKPSVPRRVAGMGIAGAEAGKVVSDLEQGNMFDAAVSGLGTAGGTMSQSRIKPVRRLGTALSVLVPMFQGGKEAKEFVYPNQPKDEEVQKKAMGGSVTPSPKLKSLSDFLDQLMQQAAAPAPAPAPAAPQGGMPPGMPGVPPQQPPMQQPPTQQSPLNAMMPQNFSGGGLALAKKGLEFAKKSKKATPGLDLGNVMPSATFKAAPEQTVTDPLRNAFPGIYKRPDVIAKEAAERVAPESESLKQLFGVTRDDLYEMGKGRVGNIPGVLPGAAANPKGSRAGLNVMNPRNEQRILDVLSESEKYPELVRGMDPWYIMDPAYQRLEQLVGPEEAVRKYRQLNTLTGMASPGSDVLTEMNRGTAANFLATQGRFNDFLKYGGKGFNPDAPADIQNILGHPYHMTAQGKPMQQFLESGQVQMSSPKVPMYIDASGVRQTGFQTDMPVGDAHWSRAVGLADTRGAATRKGKDVIPGASVTNPEMSQLGPWWRDKIASQVGLESVPAQARAWGAFSPQTGVESPIGAPKLELLSMKIMEAAKRYGVSPEQARDMVLMGEGYAGKKAGGLV
jgi:hypothetical protein